MKKLLVGMMVIACAFALTARGSMAVSVDLSDYLNVRFSGADGAGTARGDFDYAGFERAVMAGEESAESMPGQVMRFESTIDFAVTPDKGLKNGDTATVTATYDEDAAKCAGIDVTGNSRTFTVEGLRAALPASEDEPHGSAVELDAFDPAFWNTADGIAIDYVGTSPYGYLEMVNNLPSENPLSNVGYQFSERQNVHEGDEIAVTAYFTLYEMKEEYYFKSLSGTYTVGAVDHYLMDASELGSDAVASIRQAAKACAEESLSGYLEFRTESDYKGFYNGEAITANAIQPGETAYAIRNSDGFIEYLVIPCYVSVTVQEPDWMENARAYDYDLVFLCTVNNIIVHADGSVTTGELELGQKGTADIESMLIDDLKSWFFSEAAFEAIEFPQEQQSP